MIVRTSCGNSPRPSSLVTQRNELSSYPGLPSRFERVTTRTVVERHLNGCLFLQLASLPFGGGGVYIYRGRGYRGPAGSHPVP